MIKLQNIRVDKTIESFSGFQQKYMLMSDLHLGSADCDLDEIHKYLKWAEAENAEIMLLGDVLDMILPKDMKRFQLSSLAPEIRASDDIVGASIAYACRILDPYKNRITMIAVGNHEDAVLTHHGFDPISALIGRLDVPIAHGGYGGYYIDRYSLRSSNSMTKTVFRYHHGAGGQSPRTLGVMPLMDMGASAPMADILWQGHRHNKLVNATTVYEMIVPNTLEVTYHKQLQVMTGGFLKPNAGYALKKGMKPQNNGGMLITVTVNSHTFEKDIRVTI